MTDTNNPETDAKEAQFRATWLHQHAAPSQWLIVTADEMTVLKEVFHGNPMEKNSDIIARHMRALIVTVTNPQQKGGEEPCPSKTPSQVSNAAPTSDPEGAATSYEPCLICGKPVFEYVPQICCSGFECGCMGQPINPCVCSERCDKALYENIGMSFEDRRIKCGIEKWVDTATPPMTLAQQIALALYPKREDERQYPMFLAYRERAERTIASVLSRQTSLSVTEAAREIVRLPRFDLLTTGGGGEALHQVESILTRLRAQDAEELRRLTKALHDASQVSPTERDGIECHISSMISDAEREEMGLTGRQLHMQVLRVLSAYRDAIKDRDQLRSQLEASQAECAQLNRELGKRFDLEKVIDERDDDLNGLKLDLEKAQAECEKQKAEAERWRGEEGL